MKYSEQLQKKNYINDSFDAWVPIDMGGNAGHSASVTGGAGLVVHPVYGSSTGGNLSVDAVGDRWYCFHKGSEGGGDVLKWTPCISLG